MFINLFFKKKVIIGKIMVFNKVIQEQILEEQGYHQLNIFYNLLNKI